MCKCVIAVGIGVKFHVTEGLYLCVAFVCLLALWLTISSNTATVVFTDDVAFQPIIFNPQCGL